MRFIFIMCLIFAVFKPTQCYSDSTIVEEWTIEIDEDGDVEQKYGIKRANEKTDEENYTRNDLKGKVATYTKMKKTGFTLAGVGGGMLLLGIILVASADWETESTPTGVQKTTHDPGGIIGILLIAPGAPMSLIGLILGGIGSSKVTEYEGRLRNFSISVDFSMKTKGLRLSYDF